MTAPGLTAAEIIALLGLERHPEGGWYRQTFKDETLTAIYFLLEAGQESRWHRVHGSVEIWHFHAGAPLLLSVGAETVTFGAARRSVAEGAIAGGLDSGR